MKNYLSFGGGVNSVALYLYLLDEGWDFEAIFVDHGTDWPETYEYVRMFMKKYPLTIVRPNRRIITPHEKIFDNLYDFCWAEKMFPSRVVRWCTADFKRTPLNKYQESPSFVHIAFDYSERHRAKIHSDKGREFRYLLIESEMDRLDCKRLIKSHGLPIPIKSGCYICPFQRVGQLKELRRKHPELFCKLEQLENRNNQKREQLGSEPYYSFRKPVGDVVKKAVESNQIPVWDQDKYPPCECML